MFQTGTVVLGLQFSSVTFPAATAAAVVAAVGARLLVLQVFVVVNSSTSRRRTGKDNVTKYPASALGDDSPKAHAAS